MKSCNTFDRFVWKEDFKDDVLSEIIDYEKYKQGDDEEREIESVVFEAEDKNECAGEGDVAGRASAEKQAEKASENIVFHFTERQEIATIGAK